MRLLLVALALFTSAVAQAESGLEELIEQMRKGKRDLTQLNSEMGSLTAANERDKKEYDLYFENFGQIERRKERETETFRKEKAEPRMKRADAMIKEWNDSCSAESRGELPQAEYDACMARRAQVEPEVERIREAVKRDAEEFHRTNIAPLENAQQRQKTRMDALAAQIKSRFAQWLEKQEKADGLTARLDRIRAELVERCRTAKKLETVKHCASIGWDGTDESLKALGED